MAAKNLDRIRDEKINGVIFDMSPAPNFRHSEICGNLYLKIRMGLKGSLCKVFMENIDYKYNEQTDDYLEPDIIICCDPKDIKGNSYYGTPKFIAEVISPSTAKRDKGIKKDIYEKSGVSEYWIISPNGESIDIYYLKNGRYELHDVCTLDEDAESEDYNENMQITLREFPITFTLGEIFEK